MLDSHNSESDIPELECEYELLESDWTENLPSGELYLKAYKRYLPNTADFNRFN
uniref:Uncharacterized protein n=1 Tax=Ciona savignyi TaxID=51511 RepID=H2ZCG5_CIOSA